MAPSTFPSRLCEQRQSRETAFRYRDDARFIGSRRRARPAKQLPRS